MPNITAVKIFQSGIHSRKASKEIAEVLSEELRNSSIRYVRKHLALMNLPEDAFSQETLEWITLLKHFS